MREFETGATRDTDVGKPDLEGYLCPFVLERYAQYMGKNRVQADGNVRDSDNWQKGIPLAAYMKSMWRHFHDAWLAYRAGDFTDWMEECLCAIMFNAMGMLHEVLKEKREAPPTMQEVITAVHDELVASRWWAEGNSAPKAVKWDEGCSGGMGPMAPSMEDKPSRAEAIKETFNAAFPGSRLGQREPNQQEKL